MIALEARELSKSFGGLRVTANVSLAVEAGERRLIIGPNGAGKTTLFNLITGELRPDAGTVHLFNRDITRLASRRRPPTLTLLPSGRSMSPRTVRTTGVNDA